ncbi:hypothetical protein EV424DRAFT_1412259 [Suillus variegatus]|nr:hypothetical protein EV424DRAFT_1412259 [Suillus variegatus]
MIVSLLRILSLDSYSSDSQIGTRLQFDTKVAPSSPRDPHPPHHILSFRLDRQWRACTQGSEKHCDMSRFLGTRAYVLFSAPPNHQISAFASNRANALSPCSGTWKTFYRGLILRAHLELRQGNHYLFRKYGRHRFTRFSHPQAWSASLVIL